MINVKQIKDKNLSFFRTTHYFERFGEFSDLAQYQEYCKWAEENKAKVFILANGSNTLFTRRNIRSLVLKNKLPSHFNILPGNRIEASSSTLIADVLNYCYKNSFASFYYLASVPATVGGALAMNAGTGQNGPDYISKCLKPPIIGYSTIYDFVETVTFYDAKDNSIKTIGKDEAITGYRETIFTGIQSCLILSAVLKFAQISIEGNPIVERVKWSKEFQDHSAPNCGSVFKKGYKLRLFRGLRVGGTSFSSKTSNWIVNKSESSFQIVALVTVIKGLHKIFGKKAVVELICVD
ncbi:MAG: FAD-binding protein [Gemmatimonadaceae bacterium]|nr:FAD-binding protein [Gloeobacterales cyanobacterium ES-bin-141]